MVVGPKRIRVEDGTDLGRALDESDKTPVELEKDGVVFLVRRHDGDALPSYDAEAVRATLRKAPKLLTPEEAETLKAEVYLARERGTRPAEPS